jgi:hypothetical protein
VHITNVYYIQSLTHQATRLLVYTEAKSLITS